jgi:hypothetical protein
MRRAAILLILVTNLAGCRFVDSNASGRLQFEGSDPMGAFSGELGAFDCSARFSAGALRVAFSLGGRENVLVVGVGREYVHVRTRGADWDLERSACLAYDVRTWFDVEKHLHVIVAVDCTSAEGVHVQGSVRSDGCHVIRPN